MHEALQEALVNALIHADYSGQGGIVIDRYLSRFEFSNPGTLLVSREQLLRGSVSECRNKSLQLMFQMLGVGDKAGSGIDKIRRSWAAEHWQSPSIQETLRPDRVMLVLPMVSMLPEATVQELRTRFGSAFEGLDRDEVQAVVTAAIEEEITNQRLQETLTLHRVDITKLLQGLVRKGLLVPEGFGRWTRYALPERGSEGNPLVSTESPLVSTESPLVREGSPLVSTGGGGPHHPPRVGSLDRQGARFRACSNGDRGAGNRGALFGPVRSLIGIGTAVEPQSATAARLHREAGRARRRRAAVSG